MSGEIFNDSSMLEIFRAEVETHVESMTSGLLALERTPTDTSHLDEMMRGAHSIKGAARIVGIDPAVRVAHVMEDGFVAAQTGKLTLRPEHVDVLLRGVDMLNRIANASNASPVDWKPFEGEASLLVAEITAVLAGTPAVSKSASAAHASERGSTELPSTTILVRTLEPVGDVTIPLSEFFDASAAETARIAFVSALDAKNPLIRFDLSLTRDLDATGLAFLAAVPANVGSNGPRVELVGTMTELQQVLEVTGVNRLYSSGGR